MVYITHPNGLSSLRRILILWEGKCLITSYVPSFVLVDMYPNIYTKSIQMLLLFLTNCIYTPSPVMRGLKIELLFLLGMLCHWSCLYHIRSCNERSHRSCPFRRIHDGYGKYIWHCTHHTTHGEWTCGPSQEAVAPGQYQSGIE